MSETRGVQHAGQVDSANTGSATHHFCTIPGRLSLLICKMGKQEPCRVVVRMGRDDAVRDPGVKDMPFL